MASSIAANGASYQRQRRVAEGSAGDLRAVVDSLIAELVL
jgi:carboxylate-amine ligase